MSNFLFIRSKFEISDKILNQVNLNLDSKYLKKKKEIIRLKTKNYYYHFILNGTNPKNIIRERKGLILLFTGNVYNLKSSKKKIYT